MHFIQFLLQCKNNQGLLLYMNKRGCASIYARSMRQKPNSELQGRICPWRAASQFPAAIQRRDGASSSGCLSSLLPARITGGLKRHTVLFLKAPLHMQQNHTVHIRLSCTIFFLDCSWKIHNFRMVCISAGERSLCCLLPAPA